MTTQKQTQTKAQNELKRLFLSKTQDVLEKFLESYTSEYGLKIVDCFIKLKFVGGITAESEFVRAALKIPGAPRIKKKEKEKMMKAVFSTLNKVKKVKFESFLRDTILVDFEKSLRKFLIKKLSVLGTNWQNKVIPPIISKKLKRLKKKQIGKGRKPKKLIEYASLGTFYSIIEYSPCWKILEPCFGNKEWLKEKLIDELDDYVRAPLYHSDNIPNDYHARRDSAIKSIIDKMEACK